jgi:hypothetical protein
MSQWAETLKGGLRWQPFIENLKQVPFQNHFKWLENKNDLYRKGAMSLGNKRFLNSGAPMFALKDATKWRLSKHFIAFPLRMSTASSR